jgi:hypothetical protein
VFLKIKKAILTDSLKRFRIARILFGMDRFHRANIGAGATVGADFGIDLVDVAFRDRFNGALVDASSASSAIFIYFISHDDRNFCPPERSWLIIGFAEQN